MAIQALLLRDIAKLKTDLSRADMKLPPGLAGMYGEVLVWKELERIFKRKGFKVEFGSGSSKADIVLIKGKRKINIEIKTSRLKQESPGILYGFAINIKKCKSHPEKIFVHPTRGKIRGDFCYFHFIVAVSLLNNLKASFYIFPREFIIKHEKQLRNRSRRFKSATHRILFIEKENKSKEITNFDRKMKKLKNRYKNAWQLIK